MWQRIEVEGGQKKEEEEGVVEEEATKDEPDITNPDSVDKRISNNQITNTNNNYISIQKMRRGLEAFEFFEVPGFFC